MTSIEPEYERYTYEELLDARRHIDEEQFPERVIRLEKYIQRGPRPISENCPPIQAIKKIDIVHESKSRFNVEPNTYRNLLLSTLLVLMAINAITVIYQGSMLPVLSIALQAGVFSVTLARLSVAVLVIRLWASLLVIGGLGYYVSLLGGFIVGIVGSDVHAFFPDNFTLQLLIFYTTILLAGLWFFKYAPLVRETKKGQVC